VPMVRRSAESRNAQPRLPLDGGAAYARIDPPSRPRGRFARSPALAPNTLIVPHRAFRHLISVPATRRGRERPRRRRRRRNRPPETLRQEGPRRDSGSLERRRAHARVPHRRSKGPRGPESLRFRDRGGSAALAISPTG
jgi:hypothetical protein